MRNAIKATVFDTARNVLRSITFTEMPPALLVYHAIGTLGEERALGDSPRYFVPNPASLLAGVRLEGHGLEYHEVDTVQPIT